jgi:hypothetical protein
MEGKRVRSKVGGGVFVMPGALHVERWRSRKDTTCGVGVKKHGIRTRVPFIF